MPTAAPQLRVLAGGLAPARVLVVDDDERNLLAIQTVVEEVAEVVTAKSGEEALRHLLKEEFAVILLDVFMPGIDGYETAQIIRQREQSKRIPIIFLTAINKEDSHMLRGYAMGAVDYVFKPFEPAILRSKVAVFVELFEKTREIQAKAEREQRLLEENLRANRAKLEAEQALRQAEERQALVIRSLPIILFARELAGELTPPQIIGGNLARVTGFDLPPTIEAWRERLHPDDRERIARSYERLPAEGAMELEYRWRCADETYRHFLEQTMVFRHADGGASEIVGTILDVTDRRELESQLAQAQKMDAIGQLTGGVAHDFNNLLAAILGGLGLIERRAQLEPEVGKIVDMTRRAAEQGAELVRRMLAFSRRQQLTPDVVEIASLEQTMAGLVSHTLGGLVEVEWRLADVEGAAFVDRSQLELAIINLAINARDAMPDGGTISIEAASHVLEQASDEGLQPGDYITLSVEDTGCGIAPDIIERVLEPFFTTKGVGQGTGLGLSMVYGFVKQSGGGLKVDSKQGHGTRIEMWLPRAVVGHRDEVPATRRLTAAADVEGLRVLLVDDHETVRETTASALQDRGCKVVSAATGAEAVALIEEDSTAFDILITDYAMPAMSGVEVVRRARELRPGFPALIFTGYADSGAIGGRPEGVTLLAKPFADEAMLQAIRAAVTRAS